MATTIKARTARKPHLCEGCSWTPSLRGVPTILPGHRYLLHTAFPDGEINQSDRPYSIAECIACAEAAAAVERSRGIALACVTHCCGDVPCALLFKHDGDHSCRRCGGAR